MVGRSPTAPAAEAPPQDHRKWVKTPIVIQMEAAECGASCLAIVLGYYGCHIPLEKLRYQCGVSRNGCNAWSIVEAAHSYGMEAEGYEVAPEGLSELQTPSILFWNHNHFVVLEGFTSDGQVRINDPESGRRLIPYEELVRCYSNVALELKPSPQFKQVGKPSRLRDALYERLGKLKAVMAFLIVAELFLALLAIATPTFSQIFIDKVLIRGYWSWRLPILGLLALVCLTLGFLLTLRQEILRRLRAKLSVCFSSQFFWHVLKLPYLFFFQRFGGEIVQRIRLNSVVTEAITSELALSILNIFFVVLYGVIMVHYDVVISILAFLATALNLLAWRWISESRKADYARLIREQTQMIGASLDILLAIESIKALAAESYFFARIVGRQTANTNSWQRIGAKDVLLVSVSKLSQDFAMVTLLTLGCWRVMQGDLTIGMLIAFQMLVIRFTSPFGQLVGSGTRMQSLKIDLDRLNDVLMNSTDPLIDVTYTGPVTAAAEGILEFRDVTFGYSPTDVPLFDGLTFSIAAGERVAIVGRTGSGKSTIAHLATGLLLPWSGTVLYDGTALPQCGRDYLSRHVSVVNQEIFLFAGSFRQNITLWDDTIAADIVQEAAKEACIHDEIMSRHGGYSAHIIEGGRNLSEGQRQRLEMARALVRRPSLLILDEATSALDTETEERVFQQVFQRPMACLVITHRMSAIRHCQRILVLDRGRIVQQGTHEALQEQDGLYRTLIYNDTLRMR